MRSHRLHVQRVGREVGVQEAEGVAEHHPERPRGCAVPGALQVEVAREEEEPLGARLDPEPPLSPALVGERADRATAGRRGPRDRRRSSTS